MDVVRDYTRAGESVRTRRDATGLTQEQLAVSSGVSVATIRKIENNQPVRMSTLRKVIQAFAASGDGFGEQVIRDAGSEEATSGGDPELTSLPNETLIKRQVDLAARQAEVAQELNRRLLTRTTEPPPGGEMTIEEAVELGRKGLHGGSEE